MEELRGQEGRACGSGGTSLEGAREELRGRREELGGQQG